MRKTGNINFVLIGARATGKTVYLASLFLNEKSVTSKDGHTIEYLQPLSDSLLGGKYPQATAGTLHELKFNYKDEDISCQIQIDDVDGHFVETLHKEDDTTQKQRDILIQNIKNSEGIIFFFPFEENFKEESIKSFNYEIDTIISKIAEMYNNHDHIPIPAVIALSKWDNSPDFKAENEDEKVLDYIERNKFLKLAKEKIEHHFPNLSIIPISAVGKDMEQMNPYNLEKPLRFFIDETYRLWEKKIESLKGNDKDLLKYLSKIYFDMKFYKNGKYNTMYTDIEKKFADEIELKSNKLQDYMQFTQVQEEYQNITPYLLQSDRDKLEEIGKKLKSKQTLKKASWGTGIIIAISLLGLGVAGWYVKSKVLKTENELYSDLVVEYENHNYPDAMEDVSDYQDKFKDTLDTEHKNRVEEIKNRIVRHYNLKLEKILSSNSLLTQYDELNVLNSEIDDFDNMNTLRIKNKYKKIKELKKGYEKIFSFSIENMTDLDEISKVLNELSSYNFKETVSLKENFEASLLSVANNLIAEKELSDTDKIDNLLGAFTALNIDNQEVVKRLIDKKNNVEKNNKYNALKSDISDKNYKETISKVESDWSDEYDVQQTEIIKHILVKKFNDKVEHILKKTPSYVEDIDEYNDLKKKSSKIDFLEKNTIIEKIKYIPTLNSDNSLKYQEKLNILKIFSKVLKDGVSNVKITFGTNREENEPLGFECSSEGQIILQIDTTIYNYEEDYGTCQGLKITWESKQVFKNTKYQVEVIEKDLVDNDHFKFNFSLTKNQLIKMNNSDYFKIDINDDYYISFGKE